MADQRDENMETGSGQPERVGRVIVDYGENERDYTPGEAPSRDQLPLIILAGIIAIAVMVGAMLLILPGVFEM